MTKTAEKPYPLGLHISICPFKGVPPGLSPYITKDRAVIQHDENSNESPGANILFY